MEKISNKHVFVFNSDYNGGEQLVLCTIKHTLDEGVGYDQELILNSYNCSASIKANFFIPENLRKLADELESL